MRGPIPRVVEWFVSLFVCVCLFSFSVLMLTGLGYVVALIIKNMRSW